MKSSETTVRTPDPKIESPPMHFAEDLTKGGVRAEIILGEQIYTLRITRSGKLILTK